MHRTARWVESVSDGLIVTAGGASSVVPVAERRSGRLPTVAVPAGLGLLGSVLVLLTGGRAATVAGVTPPSHWLGLLDLPVGDLVGWVPVGLIAGVSLLVGAWLWLVQLARGNQLSTRAVALLIALWATPILLGPPLLSLDAYSYLAQGEMQRLGLDPYQLGPAALGPSRALSAVDPFWQHARAPYGPLALLFARMCAATGGPVAELAALHVVAGLSVLVIGVCLSAACPAPRRAMVLTLGVANPLVLLQLLSAGHWEALMAAMVVAGLALWRRGHPLAAVALAAVAAAVKFPALLAVVVLAIAYLRTQPSPGHRLRAAGVVTAAAVTPWLLLVLVVPNPFGFLGAVATPLAGRTLYAPTTLTAEALAAAGHLLDVSVDFDALLGVTRATGILLAALVVLGLVWTGNRRPPAETVGLGLLTVAVLGPVLYPWYLAWGLLPLLVATHRYDGLVVGLSAVGVFTALPGCQHLVVLLPEVAEHPSRTTFIALVLVGTAAGWLPGAGARRSARRPCA